MNDFWNERYSGDDYKFGTAPAAFLTREGPRIPARSDVLVVADGEGRNGVWLAEQGHRVTTFDAAARGVAKARALAEARGVETDAHLATLETWDWSVTHDAVVAIFIQFVPPEDWPRLFADLARAVRPGGLLLLHGYAPRQIDYGTGGPPSAANMYELDMLDAAFAGWDVLTRRDYDAVIEEGTGHSGLSGLIDFVVRKPG